mgnify:CR=1 FL=1
MIGRMARAWLAAVVLVLGSVAPSAAMAADLGALGATLAGATSTECRETPAVQGGAADLALKAQLLLALCRDNHVAAGALA